MWVLAQVDGQWLYFDPTSDRGRVDYGFQYFGVGEDALFRYTWDREGARSLTEALVPNRENWENGSDAYPCIRHCRFRLPGESSSWPRRR